MNLINRESFEILLYHMIGPKTQTHPALGICIYQNATLYPIIIQMPLKEKERNHHIT